LGSFDINAFGLEDFTITLVYLATTIIFPPESEDQFPSSAIDYHYSKDDDTWYERTIYTCIAYKTEDSPTGIRTWVDTKLDGWTDEDGIAWTTSHLIKGGDIQTQSFLNGAKAYHATMQWKKTTPWAACAVDPDPASDFSVLNEGAIE
jgi:hypothetical protein